jgi:peptidyl-prolyl cis-trans isomerase SurA
MGVWIGMMIWLVTPPTALATSKVLDRIVAVVNDDIILMSELNDRIKPYVQRVQQQGYDPEKERQMLFQVREEMLNRMVDEKLTEQEIKRNDIHVDDAMVDETIERIKEANYFTDEDLRRYLEQQQMTMEQYREQVKEQILRSRLVNYQIKSKIVITEEDIRGYYESHPEIYGGERRYHLRNILMRVPEFSTGAEKQAIRDRMMDLRSQIEGGASFADLARAFSQSPASADGGDIGEFKEGALSPQIKEALDGLNPGQTTAVLDTDQGLQLFYVEAINLTEGKPLESVKEEIRQKLYTAAVDEKFLSWLEELRNQSHIRIIN